MLIWTGPIGPLQATLLRSCHTCLLMHSQPLLLLLLHSRPLLLLLLLLLLCRSHSWTLYTRLQVLLCCAVLDAHHAPTRPSSSSSAARPPHLSILVAPPCPHTT
jgi:hypothetical protein